MELPKGINSISPANPEVAVEAAPAVCPVVEQYEASKLKYDPTTTLEDISNLWLDGAMGNKTKVTKALGITIKTVYNKLDARK